MATQISKKKKFVADGVLFAELNELLTRELAEEGYSGVEVRVTPSKTEVVIRATRTQSVLGEKGRRIRELTSVVQKRFGFPENSVELFVEKVANRGLCAIAQAESLRYKLVGGLAVRRACYGVLRYGKFARSDLTTLVSTRVLSPPQCLDGGVVGLFRGLQSRRCMSLTVCSFL